MKYIPFLFVLLAALLQCKPAHQNPEGPQSKIIREMIHAVNAKDAPAYVANFSEEVQVFLEGELRVDGRGALQKNRSRHFERHPDVRSEIQYLLEIDNKVIMHDKVWLTEDDEEGKDIVEIFTFKNNQVVRVDVVQPKDLFD